MDALGRARTRRRIAAAALAFAALLLAAFWLLREPPVTAHPPLWRISQGDRQAWLLGTIHAVPAGTRWLSPAVAQAVQESDLLILEVTGLEAERRDRAMFERLGRSPGLPPIVDRLDATGRARLAALRKAAPDVLADLDGYESWAAALLVNAAATRGLSQAEAPEERLAALFSADGRAVRGLETIEDQLGAFDGLNEADQHALLAQALAEADEAPRQLARLHARWAAGDLPALEALFLAPLERTPHLRAALIDRRNTLWAERIDALLRREGKRPFIAVGTGHMLGTGGLPARLAAAGWQVERIQ